MKAEIMNITPSMAKKMLERNPYNRNISKRTVEIYAEAMRRNEWHSNGESISFDEDGNLINGQHRLAACIKANVPFCSTVVTGVLRQDSYLFDKGRGRTIANTIAIGQAHGEMDEGKIFTSNNMISTARYLLMLMDVENESGDIANYKNSRYETGITPERIYGYIRKHRDAFEWLLIQSGKMKRGVRRTAIHAALVQAYESGYNAEKLDDFCACLATGYMKHPGDKLIIKLRERLMESRIDSAQYRTETYLVTQHVLKAYLEGRYSTRLKAGNEYYKGAYVE